MMMSKLGAICTPGRVQRGPAYCLGGIRHKGGASLIQALVWNVGTGRPDDKGRSSKWQPPESESTDAGTGAIVKEISNAKRSILVQAYSFTSASIAKVADSGPSSLMGGVKRGPTHPPTEKWEF